MPECMHFPDDPNASCSICNKPKADNPWQIDEGEGIEARYGGKCVTCKGTIYPGDRIHPAEEWGTQHADRSTGQEWEHVDCRSTSG